MNRNQQLKICYMNRNYIYCKPGDGNGQPPPPPIKIQGVNKPEIDNEDEN